MSKKVRNNKNGDQLLHDQWFFLPTKHLNLDKIPFTLFSLFARWALWCFQGRFSSTFTLRDLPELVGCSLFLLRFCFNGISVCFLDDLNKTTSVLLLFKHSAHLLDFSSLHELVYSLFLLNCNLDNLYPVHIKWEKSWNKLERAGMSWNHLEQAWTI